FFSSRRRHTRSLRDWSSDVCSSDLNSLPAANAGRGDSIAQFRAAEFTRKRKSEPDAGCRQRMPNRNRAAIHIEFVAVDLQLALHSDELRGKRFVDLESIDLT